MATSGPSHRALINSCLGLPQMKSKSGLTPIPAVPYILLKITIRPCHSPVSTALEASSITHLHLLAPHPPARMSADHVPGSAVRTYVDNSLNSSPLGEVGSIVPTF